MARRHYDNKNEILKRLRENEIIQNRADKAISASYTAYMMVALLTLYEDLQFRDRRLNMFIDGFQKRFDKFDKEELTVEEMQRRLYDNAGIVVEGPK